MNEAVFIIRKNFSCLFSSKNYTLAVEFSELEPYMDRVVEVGQRLVSLGIDSAKLQTLREAVHACLFDIFGAASRYVDRPGGPIDYSIGVMRLRPDIANGVGKTFVAENGITDPRMVEAIREYVIAVAAEKLFIAVNIVREEEAVPYRDSEED